MGSRGFERSGGDDQQFVLMCAKKCTHAEWFPPVFGARLNKFPKTVFDSSSCVIAPSRIVCGILRAEIDCVSKTYKNSLEPRLG